ncbi:phosphotransferase [Herbaspirillum rhizosphaerae]|uniref:Phosphotransferase n=1 Tax=Herbaspirillum rhizosphaerae TaxID=346179 RepID=A0ABW8ZAV8_9BURK
MANRELTEKIASLLLSSGIDPAGLSLMIVGGGGNNQVFSVDLNAGRYLAKAYFNHPADTRDRLGAEYAFLSHASAIGLKNVPTPIVCSAQDHLGIYEFIDGNKLTANELQPTHVRSAAQFIAALNARGHANNALSEKLPTASEACFSVAQHLEMVDRRLLRLQEITDDDDLSRKAKNLIGRIAGTWHGHRLRIAGATVPDLHDDDRCISPSDFGFHNALLKSDGQLCFIDFEYAGWDDPAKMIGDFFCQPAVPVSQTYFDDFVTTAVSYSTRPEILRERARLLLPAFQLKWCCIMLNEFLPAAAKRRQFADPTLSLEQRQRMQFDKTEHFFHSWLV